RGWGWRPYTWATACSPIQNWTRATWANKANTTADVGMVVMKWTHPLCGSAAMSQNDFKTSEIIEPQEASPMKKLSVAGIDMAQQVFLLVVMDEQGSILSRQRLYRAQVMASIAPLSQTLIGLQACGGADDWARRFRGLGHEVKRMAP